MFEMSLLIFWLWFLILVICFFSLKPPLCLNVCLIWRNFKGQQSQFHCEDTCEICCATWIFSVYWYVWKLFLPDLVWDHQHTGWPACAGGLTEKAHGPRLFPQPPAALNCSGKNGWMSVQQCRVTLAVCSGGDSTDRRVCRFPCQPNSSDR